MLKIHLKETKTKIDIVDYDVTFPFSIYTQQKPDVDVYWKINAIQTKGIIKGFRLLYANKIDFSWQNLPDVTVTPYGAKYEGTDASGNELEMRDMNIANDHAAVQHILFAKKPLLYVNEKQRNVLFEKSNPRQKLPVFLLKSKEQAVANIQFFVEYTEGPNHEIGGEEIILFLNLFFGE